jgi:hypothetical protein
MSDISEEYKKMLQELQSELCPDRQPGEFTVFEYMTANHITREKATGILERGVTAGKLERPPKRNIDGCMCVVYRKLPN